MDKLISENDIALFYKTPNDEFYSKNKNTGAINWLSEDHAIVVRYLTEKSGTVEGLDKFPINSKIPFKS